MFLTPCLAALDPDHTLASLAAIFALLAFGGAIVVYGTLVRNRWGINPGEVSCPRCSVKLPRRRKPRSIRQELWGGWTCTGCGSEIDKWGGEMRVDRSAFLDRPRRRPRTIWIVASVLLLANLTYDYFFPGAVIFDLIAGLILLAWYLKHRHTVTQTPP